MSDAYRLVYSRYAKGQFSSPAFEFRVATGSEVIWRDLNDQKCATIPLASSLLDFYDKVSANTASSVPKTSKFQSGHRVVKKFLNYIVYIYDIQSDKMHRNHPKH